MKPYAKWRLRQYPSTFYCNGHKAWHVRGPSVVSRKNQRHSDRYWERLLNNPELLTDQARRKVGADVSTPATHIEVEKLIAIHRNNPQRQRSGAAKKQERAERNTSAKCYFSSLPAGSRG